MRIVLSALVGLAALLLATCSPNPAPAPSAPAQAQAQAQAQPAAGLQITRVKAKPGETCSQYVRWCVEWCTKNMAGSSVCLAGCQKRGETCLANGEWSIESESRIVTNLPPR